MTKVTIELPETFGFVRGGETFTVATGNFNADIIAQLVMHGATQKIGDAAAGKQGADATAAMQAVYETLSNGDWGRTRGGTGEPEYMRFVRDIIRKLLGADNAKKYAAMKGDADGRREFLDGLFEAQSEEAQAKIVDAAKQELEKAKAAKAESAKLAKGLGVAL